MPKQKPIDGLPKDPGKLTVCKSNPLLALGKSEMSLSEFKLLDVYLSRIDPRDSESRTVTLQRGEIEAALGITELRTEDLKSRMKGLWKPIYLESSESELDGISLFERVKARKVDGLWTVTMTCTAPAMKYIFSIEKIGYLRYKLGCVMSLTSRYSYVLFLYLEGNRFRRKWEIPLAALKNILRCNEPAYDAYYRFSDLVLKRAQKELLEKADYHFTYEPVKTGRKVTAVRFTLSDIERLPAQVQEPPDPNQVTVEEYARCIPASEPAPKPEPEPKAEAVWKYSISEDALTGIKRTASLMYPDEKALDMYIQSTRQKMERSKKQISDPVAYLDTIVHADLKTMLDSMRGNAAPKAASEPRQLDDDEAAAIRRMMDI